MENVEKIIPIENLPVIPPIPSSTLRTNLVLSGGSVRGISHLGALMRLIEEGVIDLKKIKAIAGSSVGSLVGVLIVLGFNMGEVWDLILRLDMRKLTKTNFLMFLSKCGIESGEIIHKFFEEILEKKTGCKNINFKQLYDKTGVAFTVVGSCLTTKKIIYFDHLNTPDFLVSLALRISISMPGFFTPVVIGNKKYVDGGILNNFPMNLFEDKLDETIGILICNEYDTDYKYPEEYVISIMNLFMHHFYQETANKYADQTVYVTKTPKGISSFCFDVSNELKLELLKIGINAAKDFMKKSI